MSVTAMLTIAFTWIQYIQRQTSNVLPSAFADNWGWSTTQPAQHENALRATKQIAEFLNMIIDWKKSWIWSTHKTHLPSLKKAVQREAPNEHVPELLHAMDLGSQLTYRGNAKLGKLRDRLARAKLRLQRLETLQEPLSSKARLVSAGIYPVAMYGMELIPIGSQHMDALRTGVANALYGYSVSRNSAIAIHCTPAVQDPQMILVQRVIMAARRFLLRATSAVRENFFHMVACHSGLAHECKGPAGVLKYHLTKFGWQMDKLGYLAINGFVKFAFLEVGLSTLMRLCQQQWQEQILDHTDRKALKGLPPICRISTIQVLRKFPPAQQVKLLNEIAGAFQTKVQQAAWDDQVNPHCPHCGELDTRQHRVLTCHALHDLREKYAETFHWMEETGSAMSDLPVAFCHQSRECHFTVQWHQVEPEIDMELHGRIQQLDQQEQQVILYTDGSCLHPTLPEFRYAAYAVVLDCAASDEQRCQQAMRFQQTGEMPTCLHTLTTGRLPGLQDIHRAELYAIVVVLERYCNTCIYSDSATTLSQLQRVAKAKDVNELAMSPHFDLLTRIWKVWHLGERSFHKVKAHAEHQFDLPLLQQYEHLGNKMANDSAMFACSQLLPCVVNSLEDACQDQVQQQKHLKQLFEFHLEAQRRMAQLQAEKVSEENLDPGNRTTWEVLKTYHVVEPWVGPRITLNWTKHTAWGPHISRHMLDWMQKFRWPSDDSQDEVASIGVSWYELVLSFMKHAGLFFPLRRHDNQGREILVPFRNRQEVEAYGVKFSEFATTFAINFLQFTGLLSEEIWPACDRRLVKSMFVQGSTFYTSGFAQRPTYPCQEWVFQVLQPFLRANQGQSYNQLPAMDFVITEQVYRTLQTDLKGEWKVKSMAARRKMKEMRQWRERPPQLIRFGSPQ